MDLLNAWTVAPERAQVSTQATWADSLRASAKQALASDDLCSTLAPVAHCLKGLLLNLGEGEWAALARIIEKAAEAKQPYEYADVVNKMREGLSVVADYGRH
jgi:HPt (histidine-containing phosphotransfer) domain-containing protein